MENYKKIPNRYKNGNICLSWGQPFKTFTATIYEFSLQARVFAPDKPFQPNLMFIGKAGAYPREAPAAPL
jgi:hypothetical protein